MARLKSALMTAIGVIAALVFGKILLDLLISDPAGAAHGVNKAVGGGMSFINSLETFIKAGGWVAVLFLIGFGVFIAKLVRGK